MYFKNPLIDENSLYRSFEAFWNKYHFENKLPKHGNKSRAKLLWKNKPLELKIRAFNGINNKNGISAYEYLLNQFKLIKNENTKEHHCLSDQVN